MSDEDASKCPYCAEKIQVEAIKCKHCGEWLKNDVQIVSKEPDFISTTPPEKKKTVSALKIGFGIVTFILFAFIGLAVGSWIGMIFGILLWLVATGSIGLTTDISDAGKAARQRKK